MTNLKLAALAACIVCFAGQSVAQTPAAPPVGPDFSTIQVKTIDLGNRTWMLEGAGGNVTVAVGDDGILMIDGQYAPMHDKLKAAITTLSPLPVKFLVNTHYHGDHTGGNEPFAKDGVTVVAHKNVRERLAAGSTSGITGAVTPPRPEIALPAKTYDAAVGPALEIKGRTFELKHPANAHTDGDTFVYFADANVLSTGDILAIGRYANIDVLNGGNVNGMIAAVDGWLALTNDQTKIVPGHGPLATKAKLAEFGAMLATARDRMTALIKEGKNESDILAAKPFADYDTKLNVPEAAARNFARGVYLSLK